MVTLSKDRQHPNNEMLDRPIPEGAILIPNNATKVFSGEIFDVYQWPQEMYDGSTATFEMLKRPDTVLIVCLDEHNNVITLTESQPGIGEWSYSMPGGRVDPSDESILDAAKREVKEETGYEFSSWKLVEVTQPQRKIEWFIYIYVAQGVIAKGVPTPDAGEKIQVVPVEYSEFIAHSSDARRTEVLRKCSTVEELLRYN